MDKHTMKCLNISLQFNVNPMLIPYKGLSYDFEVEIEPCKNKFFLAVTAIHKQSLRYSCINTLNQILNEFGIDKKSRMEQSEWLVSKYELQKYLTITSVLFTDKKFLQLLDSELDEDRECGEWENVRK